MMDNKNIPTTEEYRKARNKAYEEYKGIGKVFCPYLNTDVHFTSDGFRHIIYKSKGKQRHFNTQILRFNLLSKAVEIIRRSHILQEFDSIQSEMVVEDHNLKVSKIVKVAYYGFIGIIDDWKIKVIVKKTGSGNPVFWSVIPNWVTNKKRDIKKKYKTFSGNMEEN